MPASTALHFETIARAIAFVRAHPHLPPEAVAEALGLDRARWRRVLAEWAELTPERFVHCLGRAYARERLSPTPELLPETLASAPATAGQARAGQLTWEAMPPAELRAAGHAIELGHGLAVTPFGDALLAWTGRGVCHLAFRCTDEAALLAELHHLWHTAAIVRDDAHARSLVQRIFPSRSPSTSATAAARACGTVDAADADRGGVRLVLRGTAFQVRVWSALMRIPRGRLLSYRQLATLLGMPAAARSVGSAIAANTLGYLVPCHRLIRADGDVGEFRWGRERKLAMLAWEAT
ncbi:MAG: methylated-DNA--[protein]-cysteine S-methyltransferase [Thauera sp.]|nr:methylated-DNA--[protein]-cysteine S-methyltransferase [Thauera sp.]